MFVYQFAEVAQGIAERFESACYAFLHRPEEPGTRDAIVSAASRALDELSKLGSLEAENDETALPRQVSHAVYNVEDLRKWVNVAIEHGSQGSLRPPVIQEVVDHVRAAGFELKGLSDPSKMNAIRSAFSILWDPSRVDDSDYAELVSAIGDIVREQGGKGVQLIESGTMGADVAIEVRQ